MRNPGALGLILALTICGCGRKVGPPAGTGSKEAVKRYFEALVRGEWHKAYSELSAESKDRCTLEQFSRLAGDYRRSLGFEPHAVQISTCDEKGAEGIAHVVLTGQAASKDRRYKDALTLRHGDDGWRVVLPENFGQAAGR